MITLIAMISALLSRARGMHGLHIHSDRYQRFLSFSRWQRGQLCDDDEISVAAKEAGKARDEGKEYVVQDGDVLLFKFNT